MKLIVFIITFIFIIESGQNNDIPQTSDDIHHKKEYGSISFDTLVGPLPRLLRNQHRPYLVTADIEVSADQTVTIEPGVVILFKDFSGLHVQGKLLALGTQKHPIIFTSEFDTLYNKSSNNIPNPFDWNGIYIHRGGIGTSLEHSNIFYSVYGIKSDTKFIRINPAIFKDNGKSNLTIEGKTIVTSEESFIYILNMKDASIDGVPVNILRDPLAKRRNIFRYSGLITSIAGAGGTGYFAWQAWKSDQDLKNFNDESTRTYPKSVWYDTQDKRNKQILYSFVSGAGLILGTTGFIWTFTF